MFSEGKYSPTFDLKARKTRRAAKRLRNKSTVYSPMFMLVIYTRLFTSPAVPRLRLCFCELTSLKWASTPTLFLLMSPAYSQDLTTWELVSFPWFTTNLFTDLVSLVKKKQVS